MNVICLTMPRKREAFQRLPNNMNLHNLQQVNTGIESVQLIINIQNKTSATIVSFVQYFCAILSLKIGLNCLC